MNQHFEYRAIKSISKEKYPIFIRVYLSNADAPEIYIGMLVFDKAEQYGLWISSMRFDAMHVLIEG